MRALAIIPLFCAVAYGPALASANQQTMEFSPEMVEVFKATPQVSTKLAADCRYAFELASAFVDIDMVEVRGDEATVKAETETSAKIWTLVLLREAKREGKNAVDVKGPFIRSQSRTGLSSRAKGNQGLLGAMEKQIRKCSKAMFDSSSGSIQFKSR